MNATKRLLMRNSLLYLQMFNKSSKECPPTPKLVVRKSFYKLKETQKQFQKNDGKPVWLKTSSDHYLYKATCLGVLVGVVWSLQVLHVLSFGKT